MKWSDHQHFHCSIVCVIVLHVVQFRCYKNVTFLISAALSSAEPMEDGSEALIRGNVILVVSNLTKSTYTEGITNLNLYICIS